MSPRHGLSPETLHRIKSILRPFAGEIQGVYLFGSRATGQFKPNSDIDLFLTGELDETTMKRIWTLFHESAIPHKVDIIAYNLTYYAPLKRHLDETRVLLFGPNDLLAA